MKSSIENDESTNKLRGAFFTNLGLRSFAAMRLHDQQGLWERDAERKREWSNVTSHCLVEAARVEVFAELLNLSPDVKSDLVTAAAVHDFYKKDEIKKLAANNGSWDAYAEAQLEAKAILDNSSLTPQSVRLAMAVGHQTLPEAEAILSKKYLDESDIAWLIMHYVDDYTIGSEWANPMTIEDGVPINDLTRRMNQNRSNAQPGGKYFGINQSGIEHFGEPTYDVQERIGSMVQERLAQLVADATGQEVDPASLPELIDNRLSTTIASGAHD